jgi:hypothetical protein
MTRVVATYKAEYEGRTYEIDFIARPDHRFDRVTRENVEGESIWSRVYRLKQDGSRGLELHSHHKVATRLVHVEDGGLFAKFKAEHWQPGFM